MRFKYMAVLPALLAVPAVMAQAEMGDFTVGDIRIEGLQRISEGTVYNYLPVNIGDRMDQRRVEESLRALYATGFFKDVELRRDGGTLLVIVKERPSIESFTIKGNKDIKTEDLEKSLRNVGLAKGKMFNQSTLDEVDRFLTDQYYSRGKYGVARRQGRPTCRTTRSASPSTSRKASAPRSSRSTSSATRPSPRRTLREQFKLQTPNWLSWYRQDDRYSREELSGDIEKLRSFYLDRGYADFDVVSTQVAIAPDKEDIFITLNVDEGDVYRVSEVKIAGDLVVPEQDLMGLRAGAPRRHLFAPHDHRVHRTDGAAPRPGRLRLREDRPGAAGEPADQGDLAHVPGAAGQPRLRAQHQLQRLDRHQRRGDAPRDAPDGGRLPVERRASSGRSSACSGCRSSRRSTSRRPRCLARRTSWTSISRSRKACPDSSAAASAIRSRSPSC